jgi:hypothetical protein
MPGHVLAPKILACRVVKYLDYWALILYDLVMTKTSEFPAKASEPSSSAAAKAVFRPASHTEVPLNRGGFPVTAALEVDPKSAWDARCLWCDRIFTPRATGGSAQKFCSTGHRQQFWIAARRWTMRAIEAGLLSVDCLKASQTSVHAAWGAFRS